MVGFVTRRGKNVCIGNERFLNVTNCETWVMTKLKNATRCDYILTAATATTYSALVANSCTAADKTTSPNEKLDLGVIGIGPRRTYDLTAMLKFTDIQCDAIAEVQASRRATGKKLVDDHYGTSDCVAYSDRRELLDRKDIDAVLS